MKHLLLILALALNAFATTPAAPAFAPYKVTVAEKDYTVLKPDSATSYRLQKLDGKVIGIPCEDSSAILTAETLAAFLANPPAPVVVLRQSTRVVIDRLTHDEKAALRACEVPQIRDAYDVALTEGIISEADPKFAQFRAALDQLGIIATARWPALLAP